LAQGLFFKEIIIINNSQGIFSSLFTLESGFSIAAKHPCFQLLAWYTFYRRYNTSKKQRIEMDCNEPELSGTKESSMREILHKTLGVLHGRGKVITLREHAEEKECVTDVRKNFIYMASEAPSEEKQSIPLVHISKSFDSVRRDEKFTFRVKGFYYINHNRRLIKVNYRHTLTINLHWKIKASILKKTVTMA
jgi:hypothetical protein